LLLIVLYLSDIVVSHQQRFIFVKNRKTGGCSVQIALAVYLDHPRDVIMPIVGQAEDGTPRPNNGVGEKAEIPVWHWRLKDFYWAAEGIPREYKEHLAARSIRRHVRRSIWDSCYTFSIERNPWDEAVA
jgi:hypothetical protein